MCSYSRLESYVWFLWGFSCLIVVPYIEVFNLRIRFVEITTVLVFLCLLLRIGVDKTACLKNRANFSFTVIVAFYGLALFWPLGGVLTIDVLGYMPQLGSCISPIRRLLIVIVLFIVYIYYKCDTWLLLERSFIRGFIFGCILTTVWMFIEHISFMFFKIYINEMIFMEILGLNPEHTFVNLVAPLFTGLPISLYPASGFSWDPGSTAPLVVLGWLLYIFLPKTLVGRQKLLISVLLLMAVPLSISRTAIIGVFVITVIFLSIQVGFGILRASITQNRHITKFYNSILSFYLRSIVWLVITLAILGAIACIPMKITPSSLFQGFASFVKSAVEIRTSGEQRHWTYFRLVPDALLLNLPAAIFGYGNSNVGVAMEKVGMDKLPGISSMAAKWHGNWNPESLTVTYALAGGLVGFFALGFCIVASMAKIGIDYLRRPWNVKPFAYGMILLAIFVLGMGYGFQNTAITIIIFLAFMHIWDPKMREI